MSVNKVILLGNLGKDPEVTYTPGGMAVCKFSIATSKKVKGEDVTSWHRCVAFDKRGEAIGKYVGKGQQLYIEGELQYGSYEKDGITRYTTDIIVNQFSFVGGRPDNQGQQNQYQNQGQQQNQGQGYQHDNPTYGQQQNYQNNGNYGNSNSGGGYGATPDDDIPFSCNIV